MSASLRSACDGDDLLSETVFVATARSKATLLPVLVFRRERGVVCGLGIEVCFAVVFLTGTDEGVLGFAAPAAGFR